MNDYGVTGARVEVEVRVALPVGEVWRMITAVDRYGEWSPECVYGRWLDEPVRVGSRFAAGNRFPDGFETHVTCLITAAEPERRFGWSVYGDEVVPFAHWEYVLEPEGEQTVIRQAFTHGAGDSGMRRGVLDDPAHAAEHRNGRLTQLGRNMELTIAAMVEAWH
ncbi:SRPBCC family protein [Kribbella sp. NPDC051770]|uniref:SRPBCC family protein n=1 Tax=Kribbella sp. NPDC051770 TaxID=3155413 RepID=UPI00343CB96C